MRRIITFLMLHCLLTLHSQPVTTYNERSGLTHWKVTGIVQDRHGFIWLSTWNGLNRYDGYEFRSVKAAPGDGSHVTSEVIRDMTLTTGGDILCSTETGRFLLSTSDYRRHRTDSAASIPHSTTLRDREGNIWQVQRYGVTKISHLRHPAHLIEGTANVQARSFLRDDRNRWWLATKEDESIRIYRSDNTLLGYLGIDGSIHRQPTPFGYRAYCIMQTERGDIWIGCKPGMLLRLREQADENFEIQQITADRLAAAGIYDIVEDAQGCLWLATFGSGIVCIPDPQAPVPSYVSLGGKERVRRLLATARGHVLAATTDGLLIGRIDRQDISQTRFRRIKREGSRTASLAGNATMDIADIGQQRIAIATENNGIDITTEESLLADSPQFVHYSTANSSLTSDACLAMTCMPDGRLLIVCSDRVMEWDPATNQTVTFSTNFWNSQSHFSEERPLLLPDSSWIFAQEQGAYRVTRQQLHSRGHKPPLVFTEWNVDGRAADLSVASRDTLVIHTDERNFSVTYAALDYTDNAAICYRTRINNQPWTHSSTNRTLTFYDISPGDYSLEVQSTDHYGRWTDNNRLLHITVVPYWHETWWAHALGWAAAILVITAAVYTVFYIRLLNRQRRELLSKYLALLAPADTPKESSMPLEVSESDRWFLERVRQYIDDNISNSDANIDDMASHAAVSRSTLNRKLRSLMGITATQLLIDARMQKAQQMLDATAADRTERPSVTDIAYRCGYSDSRYFARAFKQKYGVSPSDYGRTT